jgi:hypothetical protein
MLFFLGHKKSHHILHPFWAFAKAPTVSFPANLAVTMRLTFNIWANASRVARVHSRNLL